MPSQKTKQHPGPITAVKGATRRRRSQKERSAETQRKLIEAAIEVLQETGFSGFTIFNVARRAGLTTGAVQHHFASSQELIHGVVATLFPVLRLPIGPLAANGLAIADRVNGFVDLYWQVYSRPEYLVIWDVILGTRGQPKTRALLDSLQKEIVSGIVKDLTQLFLDVRLRPEAVQAFWVFVSSQLRGLAMLALFEPASALDADLVLLKEAVLQVLLKLARKAKRR
jgi:AcrR family transcriptional regulator